MGRPLVGKGIILRNIQLHVFLCRDFQHRGARCHGAPLPAPQHILPVIRSGSISRRGKRILRRSAAAPEPFLKRLQAAVLKIAEQELIVDKCLGYRRSSGGHFLTYHRGVVQLFRGGRYAQRYLADQKGQQQIKDTDCSELLNGFHNAKSPFVSCWVLPEYAEACRAAV